MSCSLAAIQNSRLRDSLRTVSSPIVLASQRTNVRARAKIVYLRQTSTLVEWHQPHLESARPHVDDAGQLAVRSRSVASALRRSARPMIGLGLRPEVIATATASAVSALYARTVYVRTWLALN